MDAHRRPCFDYGPLLGLEKMSIVVRVIVAVHGHTIPT